jgi:hypothetical protein
MLSLDIPCQSFSFSPLTAGVCTNPRNTDIPHQGCAINELTAIVGLARRADRVHIDSCRESV